VAFEGTKGGESLILIGQSTAMASGSEPKLIFHRYGNHYFLTEVRFPTWIRHGRLPRAKRKSNSPRPRTMSATWKSQGNRQAFPLRIKRGVIRRIRQKRTLQSAVNAPTIGIPRGLRPTRILFFCVQPMGVIAQQGI